MGEMVKDPNCAYCVEGELLAKFGYPCCEMKTGKLYVFKEQSKRGRDRAFFLYRLAKLYA